MSELPNLIARRGQLKASVTRFWKIVKTENVEIQEIEVRREKIQETWDEYEQIQSAIEMIEGIDINEQNMYREEFEASFFGAMAKAKKLIDAHSDKGSSLQSAKNISLNDNGEKCEVFNSGTGINNIQASMLNRIVPPVKLAALSVPIFTGEYREWAAFQDIFTALIHDNQNLSQVEKFFYLRSALSGDALNCIRCLETTSINYDIAWSALVSRYNNKKVLVQAHVKSIFDLEVIIGESSNKLRQFTDALTGHIRALETLGYRPYEWGPLLVHLIVTKLDKNTLREWETSTSKDKVAPVTDIIHFLEARFKVLEAIETCKNTVHRNIPTSNNQNKKTHGQSSSLVANSNMVCYICQLPHTVYKCPTLMALAVPERIKKITDLKLCKVCLRSHVAKRCNGKNCFRCSKPHNTLLHLSGRAETRKPEEEKDNVESATEKQVPEGTTTVNAHVTTQAYDQVLLSTAEVNIRSESGVAKIGRVLLDSASQCNFITESMVQMLKLKKQRVYHTVLGIGGAEQAVKSAVTVTIHSRFNNFALTFPCLVVAKITNILPSKSIGRGCIIPAEIELADTSFKHPRKIDLLLGACHFFEILCSGKIRPTSNGPIFQETQLGWIVSGPVKSENTNKENASSRCHTAVINLEENLDKMVSAFWRLEEFEADTPLTTEEKICNSNFEKTVTRNETGRFIVNLPFKDDAKVKIGRSYEIAKRRFLSLERRLQNDTILKNDYTKFMVEYESLGHMELVENEEIENPEKTCYLPHHAVRNENSVTTKLRVVFDASCKTESGYSLNDTLLKGPVIQDELIYILSRFRTYKFVLTADVQKMYRQVLIARKDSDMQRILWRVSPTLPIQIYRLVTLTYGTVPASFLATGCLRKISEEEAGLFPNACKSIVQDFYMDDYLGGADSIEKAIQLRDELICVMERAGMSLRKWLSNEPQIIKDLSESGSSKECMFDDETTKILGLYWNAKNDMLQYKVKEYDENAPTNKRSILAETAAIFDPLGLIGPSIVKAKLIIQGLWQIRLGWDDPLPENIRNEWLNYRKGLSLLNTFTVPRKIVCDQKIIKTEIHGFADASVKCYGACIYLRCTDDRGDHSTKLVCAKSKVAPLKTISLPRLELCAALLLARMAYRLVPKLNLNIVKKHFWSDSNIVLAWITSPSTNWKTFVAHRVGEIQDITEINEWSHVRTEDNPADIISRGCDAGQLANMVLWWYGPRWLCKNDEEWPATEKCETKQSMRNIPEAKSVQLAATVMEDFPLFKKYSSLDKIIRITAYWLRFRDFLVKKPKGAIGPLRVEDLERANVGLIKNIQNKHFYKEIKDLMGKNKQVSSKSKLYRLRPFIDKTGMVRVGGRLKNSVALDIFQKQPIILPGNSIYTKLLFQREHVKLMHGGPQAMTASIRLKYWPLKARSCSRETVHKCITCFRFKPIVVQPIMGDMPKERITPSRPFKISGVDFAGPLMIKESLKRKAAVIKGYACIFICFVTKAVHIEVVVDLSTKSFLRALNRFFDRRGKCSVIYSDNATNFVGANRHLKEVYALFQSNEHKRCVNEHLTKEGVEWRFIPARSPHYGGLWESAVKSMKNLLFRILGESYLTYEELSTILTRVEACLNSRPLTTMSSNPSDLSYLTPAHFLIGDSFMALPERDETTTPSNRLDRWRRVQQFSQILWKRWSREYLAQVQERTKWAGEKGPKIGMGSVVLLRDENTPPLKWKMGKVIDVKTGNDGIIRSAVVKTENGEFGRAVRQLCPLPFDGNI